MSTKDRKSSARAVADVTEGMILASVEIAVPPERVFSALTDPIQLVQWWGSDETYRTTEWTSELRVHGRYRASGRGADGSSFSVQGEYLEIDPPHKIVQTWQPDWEPGLNSTVTYRLTAIEQGTRLTVHHSGFLGRPESAQSHGQGWERVLDWLHAYVSPLD
jgi:uncharacterized protein YndB with AHSA1/START domain